MIRAADEFAARFIFCKNGTNIGNLSAYPSLVLPYLCNEINIRKASRALDEGEGIGSIHIGTKFHPYWNQVPSILEPSSIRTGTKLYRQ